MLTLVLSVAFATPAADGARLAEGGSPAVLASGIVTIALAAPTGVIAGYLAPGRSGEPCLDCAVRRHNALPVGLAVGSAALASGIVITTVGAHGMRFSATPTAGGAHFGVSGHF